jgi:hypothetical protein
MIGAKFQYLTIVFQGQSILLKRIKDFGVFEIDDMVGRLEEDEFFAAKGGLFVHVLVQIDITELQPCFKVIVEGIEVFG